MQPPARRRTARGGSALVFGIRVAPVRLSTAELLSYRPPEWAVARSSAPWLVAAARRAIALFGRAGKRHASSRLDTLR